MAILGDNKKRGEKCQLALISDSEYTDMENHFYRSIFKSNFQKKHIVG